MESFLIQYKSKIIGVYNDYNIAEDFVCSCIQNNLMNKNEVKILFFKTNSCILIKEKTFSNSSSNFLEENKEKIEKIEEKVNIVEIDPNNPQYIEINKKKIELQHQINMLKVQKKRMEQTKSIYEHDIKLFDIFYKNKQNDSKFIIPELFVDKYELIVRLKSDNNLSWKTYITEYQKINKDEDYNDLFTPNAYDETFSKKNDTAKIEEEEEFEIETDSDTDSSSD